VIPANASGSFDVYITDPSYVIIDVNGYYVSPGAIALGAGTAAAPSMTFGTDNTTGIYSSGAGTVNIATGGTNRVTVRADGDLDLTGNIRQNGSLFLHSLGTGNLAVGSSALSNSTGTNNTAGGYLALNSNTTGGYNTAYGASALSSNTMGYYNTASGTSALLNNDVGYANTANGYAALTNNTTGSNNTASGEAALLHNTTGNNNVASGEGALFGNTTGTYNTAIGVGALGSNTVGWTNVAVGNYAGHNLTTGENNIIIGSSLGTAGMANTTIIGDGMYQNRVFITGIRGIQTGSADAQSVVIDSSGQLGTINSSRRFKEDIQRMGESSSRLMELQPVTYRYKQPYADGSKPIDYGLIAEEVEAVYPDLVAKDKDGEVQSVQYHKLIPMLLNELQKQHEEIKQLKKVIATR
jgi:hypothetical protein